MDTWNHWTVVQRGRAAWLGVVALAAAFLVVWATGQPWVLVDTATVPTDCPTALGLIGRASGGAPGPVTGWAFGQAARTVGTADWLAGMCSGGHRTLLVVGAIPAITLVAVLAALLVAAGAFTRNSIIAALGVAVGAASLLLGGSFTSTLQTAGVRAAPGWTLLVTAQWALVAWAVATVVYTAAVNSSIRRRYQLVNSAVTGAGSWIRLGALGALTRPATGEGTTTPTSSV